MVSLILPMPHFEPALLESLAACVPAVADGLIREALVVTPSASSELDAVIDAAGCHLVTASGDPWALVREASTKARSDWFFVLAPGLVPAGGWIAPCGDFLAEDDKGVIGLAPLQPKGSMPNRLRIFAENSLNPLRASPALYGALIHRTALNSPRKARRARLDMMLADRRRSTGSAA